MQVLVKSAGDPARFRLPPPEPPTLRELERDHRGFPLDWRARGTHIGARSHFIGVMQDEVGSAEMVRLIKNYDAEDPGYFVEWEAAQPKWQG